MKVSLGSSKIREGELVDVPSVDPSTKNNKRAYKQVVLMTQAPVSMPHVIT